jgi:hypothetical protein
MAYQWALVDDLLASHVASRSFPGAVALVGSATGLLYQSSVGSLTYDLPPPATPTTLPATTVDTIFDMASLTKVLITTTAVMIQNQVCSLRWPFRIHSARTCKGGFSRRFFCFCLFLFFFT